MADILVVRDQITESLYRSLRGGEHGLKVVPDLIRRAIEQEVWAERKVHQMRNKIASFPSFRAYIEASPPEGLGATLELCESMIAGDQETLVLFRRATVGKKHVHKADADNVSIKPGHGNSRAYTLDRLERERPDLFAKVKAGVLSANAAAIAAGFRKPMSPLEHIRKLWHKLDKADRQRHLEWTLQQCAICGRQGKWEGGWPDGLWCDACCEEGAES
jgi:hypothetical protein